MEYKCNKCGKMIQDGREYIDPTGQYEVLCKLCNNYVVDRDRKNLQLNTIIGLLIMIIAIAVAIKSTEIGIIMGIVGLIWAVSSSFLFTYRYHG